MRNLQANENAIVPFWISVFGQMFLFFFGYIQIVFNTEKIVLEKNKANKRYFWTSLNCQLSKNVLYECKRKTIKRV